MLAFSDHFSWNCFRESEDMRCLSLRLNLATYLCMGLPSKFTFPCRCSIWFYSFDAGFEKSDDKMDMEEWVTKVCCLLYTSPSPRDRTRSRMPSSA